MRHSSRWTFYRFVCLAIYLMRYWYMQIKRDYSQPFFGSRRRRGGGGKSLFLFGILLGGLLVFVYVQFDRLQLTALDAVGMAPTPTPFASTLATEGYEYFLAGDIETAIGYFEQAIQQQPNNVNYLYEYGRMLLELDRVEEAIAIGDRAIEADRNDPRGYALKTRAMWLNGDAANAIPVGVSGLEVDSNYGPLYAALAPAYTDIGRFQQGVNYGAQAVELDPLDVDARRSYAYTLIFVGEREEAINQLEEAVSINPNLVGPYFELALQYLVSNEEELAIATYERILSLEPRNAKAYLRLCEAYSRVGLDSQAEGYCRDALDIDETYAEAYRQLGMSNFRRRNYEGAIENFEACAANGSTEVQCFYLRGLAHFYLNDCDEAWELLQESLPMAEQLADNEAVISNIREGLRLVTGTCPAYAGQALPTPIPPTPIPPTPIGGV
ncbi:MAG: hypothetical protein D6737_18030 [Chloroflexi bacterium]|nr:MAG: hypothetical protein D6737_18030 [Chloroflexota bacterium]